MQWVRRSGIQLAYPLEEKRLLKWGPPYITQPKLDGDRCRALVDEYGEVTLFSSEEHEILSVPHINEELRRAKIRNIEFDGELYVHGLPHETIHGMVSSQRVELHPNFDLVSLNIFDLINESPQAERLISLSSLFKDNTVLRKSPYIKRVEFESIKSPSLVFEKIEGYVGEGYEGIIVRHPWAPYKRARSIYMMKFKPGREDIYNIEEVIEAISQHGEPKGMIGALTCSSPTNPTSGRFNVSAGRLTHEQRKNLWDVKELLVGAKVRVAYQHLTKKNGVPRHGVVVEILWNA